MQGWKLKRVEVSVEITENEVRRPIWMLKSGQASEVYGSQGELLKASGKVTGDREKSGIHFNSSAVLPM